MRCRHRSSMGACFLLILVSLLVGCGVEDVEAPTPVLLSLSVTPADPSIAPETTVQFTATGTYSNSGKQKLTSSVTWASTDTGIATISNTPGSKGLATATAAVGSTTITATFGGVSGSATLTTSPVASIAVMAPAPPSIAPETTRQFTANGTLSDGTPQNLTTFATWASSNDMVATISNTAGSQGLATAVAAGSTSITAAFGGITSGLTLTCSNVALIAVTPATASIAKGTTQQFTAIGTLSDSATQNLTTWATWNSSNSSVATISSRGLATTVDEGSTLITATFDGVTSNQATLTVTPALLVSIAVTPVNPSIALGTTQQFIATGTFSDSTTQDISSSVTWSSSNTGVATISNATGSKGLATSVREGSTIIKAVFGGISGSTTLTVTQAVLKSITVSPASASIIIGLAQQFAASGNFTDGSIQDLTTSVTWVSSNTVVANFNPAPGFEGLAFSVGIGVTNITASFSGITSNSATLTVISF